MKKRTAGAGTIEANGYVRFEIGLKPVREHVLVAEKALGKKIPNSACVHHVNYCKSDNRPSNLVICQNDSYHSLIHIRTDALSACGNADYRKCVFCKHWGDPSSMQVKSPHGNRQFVHAQCKRDYDTKLRRAKGIFPKGYMAKPTVRLANG